MDGVDRLIFLLVVAAKLVTAADERSLICEREQVFAQALKTKDQVVLSALTEKDFYVSWTEDSVERTVTTEEHREAWIDDVIHLQMDAYKTTISDVRLIKRKGAETVAGAVVTLEESWIIRSPRGSRVEKHFLTTDFWFQLSGAWKLTQRECRSSWPYLRLP